MKSPLLSTQYIALKKVCALAALGFAANVFAAESGNACPTQMSVNQKFYIYNELPFRIRLHIPRDQWICNDYSGTGTPGQADGVILDPGSSFTLNIEKQSNKYLYSAPDSVFTLGAYYYKSRSEFVTFTTTRVGMSPGSPVVLYDPQVSKLLDDYYVLSRGKFTVRNPYGGTQQIFGEYSGAMYFEGLQKQGVAVRFALTK